MQSEHANHLPDRLLDAIAVVESGRRDPVSGAVYPWPWTINAEGVGHFYETKADAIAAAQAFQTSGIRSIDVGCAQVNLQFHPEAFASLDQAFDPAANAAFAGRFLQQLFTQTNAWPLAAAAYHSFTPDLGAEYARKVLAAWGVPQLAVSNQLVTAGPTQPGPAAAPGRVAVLLPTGNDPIRTLPMARANAVPALTNRGLEAYRALPIPISVRIGG